MIRVIPVVLVLALYVYTFIDLATARSADVRVLPRPVWLLVILVVPVLGAVAWLVFGRPVPARGDGGGFGARLRGPRGPRPSHPSRPPRPVAPDDDPDFLRGLGRDPGPDSP